MGYDEIAEAQAKRDTQEAASRKGNPRCEVQKLQAYQRAG